MMRSCRLAAIALLACALLGAPGPVAGLDFDFTMLVDSTVTVPGSSGQFNSFFSRSVGIEGDTVVFRGQGSDGSQGIYRVDGGVVSMVVNQDTPIPGTSVTFRQIGEFSTIGDGIVGFEGWNNTSGDRGLYTGTLDVISKNGDSTPDGTRNFTAYGGGCRAHRPGHRLQRLELLATANRHLQRCRRRFLVTVADLDDIAPGTGALFNTFSSLPAMDGTDVAFWGYAQNGMEGLYTDMGGGIVALVDENVVAPGTANNFSSFYTPSFDNGEIAFFAYAGGVQGVYTDVGGSLEMVADTNMEMPGLGFNFEDLDDPALAGGTIVFSGDGPYPGKEGGITPTGIYLYEQGELSKVIDYTDMLDGKQISSLGMPQLGLEHLPDGQKRLAFIASFEDGTTGLYLAESRTGAIVIPAGYGEGGDVGGGAEETGGTDVVFDFVIEGGTFSSEHSTPSYDEFFSKWDPVDGFAEGNFLIYDPGGTQQVWDVEFTGEFDGWVTLTFGYDDTQLSPYYQANEHLLGIWHYGQYGSGGSRMWRFLKDHVDTVNNMITITVDNFSPMVLGVNVVPEPSTLLLTALGLLGLAFRGWRRKRK